MSLIQRDDGEKCLPALIRLPDPGPHASQIPGDRAFGDCKTELSNSPWIFGAIQPEFSSLIWQMRSRILPWILGRPLGRLNCQRQYSRKPLRCHPITVAGFTMARTSDHRGHTLRSMIQKSRLRRLSTGRRRFRFSTATCWRRASTSKETSRRLRKKSAITAKIVPTISITNQL
jgi:hypothetical protein